MAEGTVIIENFLIGNDSPAVVGFNKRFKGKFGYDPNTFSACTYNALNVLAEAVRRDDTTREGIFKAFSNGDRWKAVQSGEFEFFADRRPDDATLLPVTIENGAYVPVETS